MRSKGHFLGYLLITNITAAGIFLLAYNLGIRDNLLSKFIAREEIDKTYYTNIFSNFDLAISIYILLCIILLIKYRAILNLIKHTSISNTLLFCLIISSLLQILFIPLINTQPIFDIKA